MNTQLVLRGPNGIKAGKLASRRKAEGVQLYSTCFEGLWLHAEVQSVIIERSIKSCIVKHTAEVRPCAEALAA